MPATVLYPNSGALNNINLLRTDLVNCVVSLFQNDYIPQPTTVLADLVEATFSGYAAKTVAALLPAYIDPAGGASAQIATIQFDHSGGAVANTVFGFWVADMGGAIILVGRFEEGVSMVQVGDSIPLDIKFNFGN